MTTTPQEHAALVDWFRRWPAKYLWQAAKNVRAGVRLLSADGCSTTFALDTGC